MGMIVQKVGIQDRREGLDSNLKNTKKPMDFTRPINQQTRNCPQIQIPKKLLKPNCRSKRDRSGEFNRKDKLLIGSLLRNNYWPILQNQWKHN